MYSEYDKHMRSGNMKRKNPIYRFVAAMAIVAVTSYSLAYGQSQYQKEIAASDENSVRVRLETAFGTVDIGSGASDKILIADMVVEPSVEMKADIKYRIENRIGLLDLMLRPVEKTRKGWGRRGSDAGTWNLKFSDRMPLRFDIEFGAGRGTFDFTGMHIEGLNLSTGASNVTIRFNEPNKGFIDDIHIESGVSRFTGEKLGNANFKNLKFEGGVGSYTLDFDGDLRHEANVSIELGIGAVTLIIPDHIGVRLQASQRLFSSVNVPGDFESIDRDEYISRNYDTARGILNIKIESGMGSVRVRR
jgi:hypothetical protein